MINILVMISQALLYGALAVLIGTFVMHLVPKAYRPDYAVPTNVLLGCVGIIPIATFMPIINVVAYIKPQYELIEALTIVLTTYTIGLAWIFIVLIAVIAFFLILLVERIDKQTHKGFAFLQLVLTIAIIGMVGWSSHAGSINVVLGTISDFIHLLSVSIWVGTVVVIAWFSTTTTNWAKFLVWYSVLAATCLGATAVSGFLLADVLINNYVNGWIVSYGQGIFIKHLFIIPLIIYAALNGFFVKYKLTVDEHFSPVKGAKAESIILFIILVVTAIFTQSSPPHGAYLTEGAISPLFKLFFDSSSITSMSVLKFAPSGIAIIFVFTSMLFFAANVVAYIKRAPIWMMILSSVLLVISVYLIFMFSVVLR